MVVRHYKDGTFQISNSLRELILPLWDIYLDMKRQSAEGFAVGYGWVEPTMDKVRKGERLTLRDLENIRQWRGPAGTIWTTRKSYTNWPRFYEEVRRLMQAVGDRSRSRLAV